MQSRLPASSSISARGLDRSIGRPSHASAREIGGAAAWWHADRRPAAPIAFAEELERAYDLLSAYRRLALKPESADSRACD
jgi:hypothetical protein